MRKTGFTWIVGASMVVPVMLGAACREADPPVAYNSDLGTDGTILLPTSYQWHNPALATGRADWHEFRGPDEVGVDSDEHDAAARGQLDSAEAEVAIRELLTEFGELAADDATVDELLDYFVGDQHESLKPILAGALDLSSALRTVRKDVTAKLPDASESIAGVFDALEAAVPLAPSADSFLPMNAGVMSANMTGASLAASYDFVIVDGDWYIKLTGDAWTATQSEIDARLTVYRSWVDGLSAGDLTADDVLQQATEAAKPVETPSEDHSADAEPDTTEADADDGAGDD